MRSVLMTLIPLLVPLIIYFAWRAVFGTERMPQWARNVPWVLLGLIGVALVAMTLSTWRFTTGAAPGSEYVPPHYEDGRFVPGQFK